MKRAILIDSALRPHFDPAPARVRWCDARAAAWSPLRRRGEAIKLAAKGPPCAS
ncbi:hypothetical protein X772_23275 [Mesorhizobium sp. LSJC280B00]|nr:hypothetical protein X772_23275 [Mesorhizobium sp. LSJC280B00]